MTTAIDKFLADGFVAVRRAVAPGVVRTCVALIEDVGDQDAPTEILVGSHLDVPRVLAPFGERGVWNGDVARELPASTFRRPSAHATGRAGDVYVCHPFLVHRATWPHRGSGPRMLAQPAIEYHPPFALREDMPVCVVERAILQGLR